MDWRKYIGLPFKDHGRHRTGIDCIGLVMMIYRECLGIELPYYQYTDVSHSESISTSVDEARAEWVASKIPKPFDVALFNHAGRPMHVGIIVRSGSMLHIQDNGLGSLIEDYTTSLWRHRLEGIYHYAG